MNLVNFLGPQDEYVVSGSDDGNWFMWDKKTRRLHDILEGDGAVVNVIEGHPYLPLVAVSGIDTTVKVCITIDTETIIDEPATQLFAPSHRERRFSRMHMAQSIIERNADAASNRDRVSLTSLAMFDLVARRIGVDRRCEHQ